MNDSVLHIKIDRGLMRYWLTICLGLGVAPFGVGQELKPGDLIWEFETGSEVMSSPAIGSDGTVYVGSWQTGIIYAINLDGTKQWEFETGGRVLSSPAIGSDGSIYVGSSWGEKGGTIYALNPDGSKKWEFFEMADPVDSSPAIGSDGTVYVGSLNRKVYAINPDGSKKWEFETGKIVNSSPAIGSDGTIYIRSWDNNLYAINPDGTKKWAFETGRYVRSSPAIGSDGTIYIGSGDGNLYAINPDGSKKWEYYVVNRVNSSPAIGSDGTIYVGSNNKKVYALKSSITGPADSPWPMFGQNAQRTAWLKVRPTLSAPVISNLKLVNIEGVFSIKFTFDRQPQYQYVIQKSKDLKDWKDDGPPIAAMPITSIYRFSRTIDTWPGEKLFYRILVE